MLAEARPAEWADLMVVTDKSMVSYLRVFLVGAACGAALKSYLKDRRLLHSYYGEATGISLC